MTSPIAILPGWGLGCGPLRKLAGAIGGDLLDLPGYADSLPNDDFTATADTLASRLAPGSILIGWSLGSLLALAIAARHPHKVGKLVLIAGTASFMQREDWPHAMPPEVLADFTAAINQAAQATLPRFVGAFNRGDQRAKAVTLELLRLADQLPAAPVLISGLNWLRDVDLRTSARHIQAPCLLIHGAADPLMPLAAAEALTDLMPDAELAVMAGCAHAPFISQPVAFTARLTTFIHA